jgi:hypothetical protein
MTTAIAEQARLGSELCRLREKYDRLLSQRETLFRKLEQGMIKTDLHTVQKIMSSLSKATARCDRVARQMYVCNDQVRQIALQRAEHQVGALRVELSRRKSHAKRDAEFVSVVSEEAPSEVQGKDESSPTSTSTATPQEASIVVLSPVRDNTRLTVDSRRFSTATVISLNHLGFPLPPDRGIGGFGSSGSSPVITTPVDESDRTLVVEIERKAVESAGSAVKASSGGVDPISQPGSANEILIYPPSHRRSTSAPMPFSPPLDLPHTPWREASEIDHSDVGVASNTAPLRLKSRKGNDRGRVRSLVVRSQSTDLMLRAKRGRESQLESVGNLIAISRGER